MNIIIPLAGLGERFQKEGYTLPKPLIPVLGKPILFYVLDNITLTSEDKVFILYNNILKTHNFYDIVTQKYPHINLIEMPNTRGAAETIYLGLEYILNNECSYNKQCVLMDCDTFYTEDVLMKVRNSSCGNAVFYTKTTNSNPIFSYIKLDNSYKIQKIREKEKISNCANTGIYCFDDIKQLHKYCNFVINNDIQFKGEFYTSCVISEMLNASIDFYGIELQESHVFSLGTPLQVKEYESNTYAFLFDLDGTLVSTDHIYFDIWNDILHTYNIMLTKELFDKYIYGQSDSYVKDNLLSHINILHHDISKQKDELMLQYISKINVIEGAVNFIKNVHREGHKIAIVTNCNRPVAETILKTIGIDEMVDILVIGGECDKPKPYSDPYAKAISYYKIKSDKCFIFEDSKTGILSGAGVCPKCIIGIETTYSSEDLIKSGADITIKDFTALSIKDLLTFSKNNITYLTQYVNNSLVLANKQPQNISWGLNKLKGGYISDVLAFEACISETEILKCVLKLENQTESYLSKMANKLGLYDREYYFYDTISKYVNIKIPPFYGLVKTEKLKNIGIILGNLNDSCDLALDLNKESIDTSLKVINAFAKLHAQFWSVELDTVFPLLKKNNDKLFCPTWGDYVNSNWPAFRKNWGYIMTEKQSILCEEIVRSFSKIQENVSNRNLTLIHGDVKSGNIFYDKQDRTPFFLDWQYVAIGKGVQDLVFFMIESFDISTIKNYFHIFKHYYYAKLIEYGVVGYSYEEYENDFKAAAMYYPFFVAIWFGTTPEDDLIDKNFPLFFIKKLLHFFDYLS